MSQDAFYMIDGVKYDRVSAICELVSNASGDGLYFAGATDAAKGAARMVRDAMDGVPPCRDAENALRRGVSLREWLENWQVYKSEAIRIRQGYADRGTVIDLLFRNMVNEGPKTLKEAEEWVESHINEVNESRLLSLKEWNAAEEQGLTTDKQPEFPYACEIEDVIPYAHALANWWQTDTGIAVYHTQAEVKDEKLKVAGHPDFIGTFAGFAVVGDIKTSAKPQPTRYHQAQLSAYAKMAGFGGINIMVTPSGVSPRLLTTGGMKKGWADFTNALKLYRNSSMAGSYESAAQTRRLAS